MTDLCASLPGASAHCVVLLCPVLIARHVLPATECLRSLATKFALRPSMRVASGMPLGARARHLTVPWREQCVRLVDQVPCGATVLLCHDRQLQGSGWPLSMLVLCCTHARCTHLLLHPQSPHSSAGPHLSDTEVPIASVHGRACDVISLQCLGPMYRPHPALLLCGCVLHSCMTQSSSLSVGPGSHCLHRRDPRAA